VTSRNGFTRPPRIAVVMVRAPGAVNANDAQATIPERCRSVSL
jgi:hypothetical protein